MQLLPWSRVQHLVLLVLPEGNVCRQLSELKLEALLRSLKLTPVDGDLSTWPPRRMPGPRVKQKRKIARLRERRRLRQVLQGMLQLRTLQQRRCGETNKNHLQRLEDALNRIMAHPVFADIATAEPAEINSAAGHLSGDQVRVAKAFAVYDRCSTAVIGKCGA